MANRWIFLALLVCASCSKEGDVAAVAPTAENACSAAYNGIWLGPSGAKLTLTPACAIEFRGSPYCVSTGTYTALLGSSGAMTIKITAHEGGTNCPSQPQFQCTYIFSAGLSLDCGGGTVAYSSVTE